MYVFAINTVPEQSERAFHLGLAALLAENVYNFGEIVSLFMMKCFLVSSEGVAA